MTQNLPGEASEYVPPQLLDQITGNPNALLSPEASDNLMSAFAASGESGALIGAQVVGAIRESLASAVGDVFFLCFIFVLFALVATAFIRELPLRGRKSSQSQEEK